MVRKVFVPHSPMKRSMEIPQGLVFNEGLRLAKLESKISVYRPLCNMTHLKKRKRERKKRQR